MSDNTKHNNNGLSAEEHYKEEGALTLETLEIASHEASSHEKHKHMGRKQGFTLSTPLAIIIAAIILGASHVGYGFVSGGTGGSQAVKTMFKGKAIEGDFVEGKENAKVVIVEYSDAECPFCIQVSPTIKKLRTEYSGKVAFVYRHFPLTQIHKNAFDEARAISCAGVVGGKDKYYAYADALFDYKMSKQTATLPKTGKEDLAKTVGLNEAEFSSCIKDNRTAQTVTDQANDGVTAGVQGTPSTFVLVKTRKGYEQVAMIDGARQYEFFKAAVEEALAR